MTKTLLLPAAKFALTTWEANGYHDSDFYASYFDETDGRIHKKLTDTTRFAGPARGWIDPNPLLNPTLDIVRKAVKALADHIFAVIRAGEHRDVLEPEDANVGDSMRLIRDAKHKGVTYPEGTEGRVFWVGAMGTFYRKGYNKPGRSNRRVGLELADGRRAFFALSACRMAREPMADAELRARAERLADECNFSAAVGGSAWDTTNPAREIWKNRPRPVLLEELLDETDRKLNEKTWEVA